MSVVHTPTRLFSSSMLMFLQVSSHTLTIDYHNVSPLTTELFIEGEETGRRRGHNQPITVRINPNKILYHVKSPEEGVVNERYRLPAFTVSN